jgi:hypothetical protein
MEKEVSLCLKVLSVVYLTCSVCPIFTNTGVLCKWEGKIVVSRVRIDRRLADKITRT